MNRVGHNRRPAACLPREQNKGLAESYVWTKYGRGRNNWLKREIS